MVATPWTTPTTIDVIEGGNRGDSRYYTLNDLVVRWMPTIG